MPIEPETAVPTPEPAPVPSLPDASAKAQTEPSGAEPSPAAQGLAGDAPVPAADPSPRRSAETAPTHAGPAATSPSTRAAAIADSPVVSEAGESLSVRTRSGRATGWLITATVLTGLLQLVLAIATPPLSVGPGAGAQKLGLVLGATVVWPLIVIGVFSIGRRFRTSRARGIILLIVWGLFSLSHASRFAAGERRASIDPHARARLESGVRSATMRDTLRSTPPQAPKPGFMDEGGLEFRLLADPFSPERRAIVAPSQPAPAPAAVASAVADDFARGSDKRFIERLEHAQEDEYHRIVAGYAHAVRARPGDDVLALERVRFIERFCFAEDVVIDSAEADRQEALDHLYSRFPDEPGTVLHRLGSLWGADLEREAQAYVAEVSRWPAEDAAAFHLMRGRAAAAAGASGEARRLAMLSFTTAPTTDAALLHAHHAADEATARARAAELLQHAVFDDAEPWLLRQKLNLLFTLGAEGSATALYDQLRTLAPEVLADSELAGPLARAGRVEEARALLAQTEATDWNRERELRRRYDFELEHGSGEQALSAYRAWHDASALADPFLRERLKVFQKHPGATWSREDIPGLVMLCAVMAAALACPLVVLLPIHYWSLLRQRRGKRGGWPGSSWNLRHAWLLLGVHAASIFAALWYFSPDSLIQWFVNEPDLTEPVIRAADLYQAQLWIWAMLGAVLLGLIARARAWRLFLPGGWGFWKSVGIGCGLALGARMILGFVASLLPEGLVAAGFSPGTITQSLFTEILNRHGSAGLLLIVGVAVPVLEEVMFRGVVLQAFARHIPFGWANVLQAVAFALIHENLPLAPFYFAMGVCTGILARRSGSLLAPMAMHIANNTLACVVLASVHAAG